MRLRPGAVVPRWNGRPFHVFAADPGVSTGCATATWEPTGLDDRLTSIDQITFNRWTMGPQDHHVELWCTLSAGFYTNIVWESFEFRQNYFEDENGRPIPKMKVELMSREYIGVLRLYCDLYNVPSHHRTASSAKLFITDEKIKQLGLWLPGKAHEHEMDGTRHLLRFMTIVMHLKKPFTDIWLPE